MTKWRFVAARPAPNQTALVRELTEAHGRSITWRLDDACQATFTLDARHELATVIEELTIDLLVYRDDELWFRGRLGASTDDVTSDTHSVALTAVDYTALFRRRKLSTAIAPWIFTNIAQGSIVRQLLDWSQGTAGGNAGVVVNSTNVPNTAQLRTITYPVGKMVGEAIDELARLDNGFDWTIDETLTARLWNPARGAARDLVLEYGSTVEKVQRTFDPAEYANSVMVTGTEGTASQTVDAADIATRPEGRIDIVESLPDVSSTSVLLARAQAALADRSTLRPVYTCTMMPGRWSPRQLWIGDTTWLQIRSGRLNVSASQRVTQITVTVDDAGVDTVDISLGRVPASTTRRLVALNRRLARVERLGTV